MDNPDSATTKVHDDAQHRHGKLHFQLALPEIVHRSPYREQSETGQYQRADKQNGVHTSEKVVQGRSGTASAVPRRLRAVYPVMWTSLLTEAAPGTPERAPRTPELYPMGSLNRRSLKETLI